MRRLTSCKRRILFLISLFILTVIFPLLFLSPHVQQEAKRFRNRKYASVDHHRQGILNLNNKRAEHIINNGKNSRQVFLDEESIRPKAINRRYKDDRHIGISREAAHGINQGVDIDKSNIDDPAAGNDDDDYGYDSYYDNKLNNKPERSEYSKWQLSAKQRQIHQIGSLLKESLHNGKHLDMYEISNKNLTNAEVPVSGTILYKFQRDQAHQQHENNSLSIVTDQVVKSAGYSDEDYNDYMNPPFRPGDFDYNHSSSLPTTLKRLSNDDQQAQDSAKQPYQHRSSRLLFVKHNGQYESNDIVRISAEANVTHDKMLVEHHGYENGEKPATQIQMPSVAWQPGTLQLDQGNITVVTDYVFWSKEAEHFVPPGLSDATVNSLVQRLSTKKVWQIKPPLWNRCGRAKNVFLILQDKTALCARYREPHSKLVHGELLSFYLARYLGIDNVPVVALSVVNSSTDQWSGHDLVSLGWNQGAITALIQWIDNLNNERSRTRLPTILLNAYKQQRPVSVTHDVMSRMTPSMIADLVQWTDLIVFDYITGHYDRIASMQDGAEQENKPSVITEPIRNLRVSTQDDKQWLIDNESGLLDAYELLYKGKSMGTKFINFHKQMLQSICVFRRGLIEKIEKLSRTKHPDSELLEYARRRDPVYAKLKLVLPQYSLFRTYFPQRINEVLAWVKQCKQNR